MTQSQHNDIVSGIGCALLVGILSFLLFGAWVIAHFIVKYW